MTDTLAASHERTDKARAGTIVVLVLGALTWLWVGAMTFPRATSGAVSDYGFFTAIAERLRAGDTLYVEVWDNKDPFVFFFLAVARNIGPNGAIGSWLLELSWVVIASIAIYVIARSVAITEVLSALAAFVLSPFILLGMPYFMGNTHLPAVALLLAAVALVYRNHPLAAGIAVGVLLFLKLVMVPMAIVVVLAALLGTKKRTALGPAIGGFVGSLLTISLLLAIRGELVPFVDTQMHNILYSQSPIVSAEYTGLVQKIAQHVVILINPHVAGAVAITGFIGLLTMPFWSSNRHRWEQLPGIWWTTASAFVMAGITIAITGKWFHHAEVFAVSSALVLVLLIGWLAQQRSYSPWLAAAIATVLTYPLAMSPPLAHITAPVFEAPDNWNSAISSDPITRVLSEREPTEVAFVGELLPRSPGLEEWTIACRHVAQRNFNPETVFKETVQCLPSAETIVVTRSLDPDPNFPAFTDYLATVEQLLSSEYRCEDTTVGRICTRQ